MRARHTAALEERDRRLGDLTVSLRKTRASANNVERAAHNSPVKERSNKKIERALAAARQRARSAETENENLQQQLKHMKQALAASRRQARLYDGGQSGVDLAREIPGRKILYIGGRTHQVPHLRAEAERVSAEFLHHDGGVEETCHRLDNLIPSVDCVVCPASCVSHEACLKAKRACRTHGKHFIILESTGLSAFRSALQTMS